MPVSKCQQVPRRQCQAVPVKRPRVVSQQVPRKICVTQGPGFGGGAGAGGFGGGGGGFGGGAGGGFGHGGGGGGGYGSGGGGGGAVGGGFADHRKDNFAKEDLHIEERKDYEEKEGDSRPGKSSHYHNFVLDGASIVNQKSGQEPLIKSKPFDDVIFVSTKNKELSIENLEKLHKKEFSNFENKFQ